MKSHRRCFYYMYFRLQCEYCDYKSDNKPHLKDHVNSIHLGIKQFRCGVCNFECASKGSMKRHVMIHTGKEKHEDNY